MSLPHNDHPAAFGQHPNANISSQIEDTNILLKTLVSLQAESILSDDAKGDGGIEDIITSLLKRLPPIFNMSNIQEIIQARSEPDAYKTVLLQEAERYNHLLTLVRETMENLQKAIKGLVLITPDIENVIRSIMEQRVPSIWLKSYPSSKSLTSWTVDLLHRINQIQSWIDNGAPTFFLLSGFTYPTGFLTAVLQNAARDKGVAIDMLSWEFSIINSSSEIKEPPKEGVYISGLFLEGARWDNKENSLAEAFPMELFSTIPVMNFRPVEGKKKNLRGNYPCPLYIYPVRAGTRDRPSFVITIDLHAGQKTEEHWTKRGVAMLLSTAE